MSSDRAQSVVAFGGGHGLAASLSALRVLVDDLTIDELTAIVTVADNGGSSGRLRKEFGVPPPGDLRMALSALCGSDEWGTTWAELIQHRFAGDGEMRGHVVGNMLIVGLWELLGDAVSALDLVAKLLGARGRVLPMATEPMDITARVRGVGEDPDAETLVEGQVAVATTEGEILEVSLTPAEPEVSKAAVEAIEQADWLVLGPGSWYTSVLPHLLVPGIRDAILASTGKVVVVLNLAEQKGETGGFNPADYLHVLRSHAPELDVHLVLADGAHTGDGAQALCLAADELGAHVELADLAISGGAAVHDPTKLAAGFASVFSRPAPPGEGD